MTTQVIVLNGGSSSGKSGIVRCLQAELADPWLAFGCDSFVDALPAKMQASDEGIAFAADGGVSVGAEFMALQAAWMDGIAQMARAGARIIIDDVFLGGAASQQRWRKAGWDHRHKLSGGAALASACLAAQFTDEPADQVKHRRCLLAAWWRHPALTSGSRLPVVAAAVALAARAVAARPLAARMVVRASSIARDTKMKLSVRAPTLTWLAAIQLPS